jgi:hypothetical protein
MFAIELIGFKLKRFGLIAVMAWRWHRHCPAPFACAQAGRVSCEQDRGFYGIQSTLCILNEPVRCRGPICVHSVCVWVGGWVDGWVGVCVRRHNQDLANSGRFYLAGAGEKWRGTLVVGERGERPSSLARARLVRPMSCPELEPSRRGSRTAAKTGRKQIISKTVRADRLFSESRPKPPAASS